MARIKLSPNQPCPCCSGLKYKRCCRPLHQGTAAISAEALMRSRYGAYAAGLAAYLIATTDAIGPLARADRDVWEAEIQAFCDSADFPGMEILDKDSGDDVAHVRFRAQLRQQGQDASFVERSRFVRRDGRWLYHSGDIEG